jgi:hypothetical protein
MLKDISPEQRLSQIDTHALKLEPFVTFGSTAACLVIYILSHENVPESWSFVVFLLFIVGMAFVSGLLATIMWFPLAVWVGRIDFQDALAAVLKPNSNPRLVQRFLEHWWDNQMALDVFVVVFRIGLCVTVYRLVGPTIGIL